ncbi:hypothetical protein HMPREF1557_01604 [Streptococcus sobrinus W1703]|uniref:Uncharacterized protein n=1 Tax=Streptococcus sobrinus W1703 TaxID=1227275 RepID=U2KI16_9STRE|nr:hypothetical protein HMPREF1557_01604 [Streptococcus sobrinus W1703]
MSSHSSQINYCVKLFNVEKARRLGVFLPASLLMSRFLPF